MQKVIEIKPIWEDYVPVLREDDLDEIIELPLLNACKELYRKNIITIMSSCNMFNIKGFDSYTQDVEMNQHLKKTYAIGEKHAWIMLDYDSLSEENKKIMAEYYKKEEENFIYSVENHDDYNDAPADFKEKCKDSMDMPHYKKRAIILRYPLTKNTTTKEVNDYYLSICQSLKPQQEKLNQEYTTRYRLLELAKKYQKPLEQIGIHIEETMLKNLYLIMPNTPMQDLYGIKGESTILWNLFLIATLDTFGLLEEYSALIILSIERNDIHFMYNGKEYHLACFKDYPKEQLLQFGNVERGIEKLKEEKELIDLFREIDDFDILLSQQYRVKKEMQKNR